MYRINPFFIILLSLGFIFSESDRDDNREYTMIFKEDFDNNSKDWINEDEIYIKGGMYVMDIDAADDDRDSWRSSIGKEYNSEGNFVIQANFISSKNSFASNVLLSCRNAPSTLLFLTTT